MRERPPPGQMSGPIDDGRDARRVSAAAPAPGALRMTVRRIAAKIIDLAVFVPAYLLLAGILLPSGADFEGVIRAFATVLGFLGFYVTADATTAVTVGATPGEWVTGIRVTTANGRVLSYSQRQDRTTDALVEGTVGLKTLLDDLLRGRLASYDAGYDVRFMRVPTTRTAIVGLLALGALGLGGALLRWGGSAGELGARIGWFIGLSSDDVLFGRTWQNPTTGRTVLLADGWRVGAVDVDQRFGSRTVVFNCLSNPLCEIRLYHFDAEGFLDETDTEAAALERLVADALRSSDVPAQFTFAVDGSLSAEGRFERVHVADSFSDERHDGTALVWFTGKRHEWAMVIRRPAHDLERAEEALSLALRLLQSTTARP